MAAKLNQPLSPSYLQMIRLLDDDYRDDESCKQRMIDLEFSIVHFLQFDLQLQTPLFFVGRFLQFFVSDDASASTAQTVEHVCGQFLKIMAYKSCYLRFSPAVQAAAASLLTVNIFTCDAAYKLNLTRSKEVLLRSSSSSTDPLSIWTPTVERHTKIA